MIGVVRGSGALREFATGVRLLAAGAKRSWMLPVMIFPAITQPFWDISVFFLVLGFGIGAEIVERNLTDAVSYLRCSPVRISTRTLVLVPLYTSAAAVVALCAVRYHVAPWIAVTAWAYCCWACTVSHFFPIHRFWRAPGWVCIVALGALPPTLAHAWGGWRAAGIAAVVVVALGWALSPRQVGLRVSRGKSQVPRRAGTQWTVSLSMGPQLRPRNRRTGVWRVFRTAAATQNGLVLWFAGAAQALAVLIISQTRVVDRSNLWVMPALLAGVGLAASSSQRTFEFLTVRPLRFGPLLAGTVLPWFALALITPVASFVWSGRTSLGSIRALDLPLRIALSTLSLMFIMGASTAGDARKSTGKTKLVNGFFSTALMVAS